jgi:hypothetical protein
MSEMGHFLDVGAFLNEAPSTPKNGHRQFDPLLPKSANRRHCAYQKTLSSVGWVGISEGVNVGYDQQMPSFAGTRT